MQAAMLARARPSFVAAAKAQRTKGIRARRSVRVCAKLELEQVAGAYANALVEVAQKTSSLEAVHADVDALASVLKENDSLKELLSNPVIAEAKKKEVVKRLAAEASFSQYTVNFLNLLIDQNRIEALDEICESFEKSYCALTDTQVATLRSAVKLEQEQQFLIAKKLQELTGSKNIKLKPVVDADLVAGFVVEYGSTQIDLSVKGQLEKITGELVATAQRM
ncbi:hypothetical protein COHA_003817 [Chlorella ohadii]|uniref:Chloroplast ATP synthase delta chain n=1 Tax=Chlorella ohadii TaxID=2649997 RepID=A0AAD5DUE6_9CHLO|nr:hypothetical protein COHA_003817 [Chlorella ohadii]